MRIILKFISLIHINSTAFPLKYKHGYKKSLQKKRSSMENRSMHLNVKKLDLRKRMYESRYFYLMLLPGIVYFIVFNYMPMYGIQLAFKDFSISRGIWGSPWIGLSKFEKLFRSPEFFSALKNTLIISFLKTFVSFPVPIMLAILLNELRYSKLKRSLQTIYTFPHFLSWVIVAGILRNLLASNGALNNLISTLGGERVSFLTTPGIFRPLLVISAIWKESGWDCIIYLTAITAIDPTLYESADIDGANRWHKMLHITWPGMKHTAVILLILAVGHAMNAGFDQIFNMYNPAVYSVADIIDTYVYRITFELQPDYGFSTAVGLFKGVTNCVLLLSANAVAKRMSDSAVI